MHSLSIISPLAAIGIAGGQGTLTAPHILPSDISTGISSLAENTALRMLMALSGSFFRKVPESNLFAHLSVA